MPTYGVIMNQAVSMAQLGNNTLATGYHSKDFIRSCSAIIFVNPAVGSAGLFHFPEGDIHDDVESQILLRQLVAEVKPSEAWVAFGHISSVADEMAMHSRLSQNAPEPMPRPSTNNLFALITWLQALLQFVPEPVHVLNGGATVSIVAGHAYITTTKPTNGVTSLHAYNPGTYEPGFRIHWRGFQRRAFTL